MILFLTSSPSLEHTDRLNPANGFVDELKRCTPGRRRGLFISSYPYWYDFTDDFGLGMKRSLEMEGIRFESYEILDGRSEFEAKELVEGSDLIILAGGHVPTQNEFFRRISLASLLRGHEGVLVGISAGSMNAATVVYAPAEEEGESLDPMYITFYPGLDLTSIQIIPHYNEEKENRLDGRPLFDDIIAKDSLGHEFYIFVDGTYFFSENDTREIRGECYLMKNGHLEKLSSEGERIVYRGR
ncbi:MAG: Type 1 glutamine amidotransferase-like domain-containing protein [Spirochaetales bacterium]|nr:Type 1 glutamine amidotransferase-like domain-containing protein [Spirochaetales bacterium]